MSCYIPAVAVANVPKTDPATELSDALADFFRAARRARGRASRRPSDGVSLAQFNVLDPLLDGPLTVGQVAEAAGVAPPTATRMLDGLVERGFVSRAADAADRRAVIMSLTPAGRRAATAKAREYDRLRKQVGAVLEPDEQRLAAQLLRRLGEVIEEL
jgi:MarR family transcriptional regulator, organic hydroperoxide resistance regulator